jgi:hypothetical protein
VTLTKRDRRFPQGLVRERLESGFERIDRIDEPTHPLQLAVILGTEQLSQKLHDRRHLDAKGAILPRDVHKWFARADYPPGVGAITWRGRRNRLAREASED